MIPDISQVNGLKELDAGDLSTFNDTWARHGVKSWIAYFPWLLGFRQSKKRTLFWEIVDGSLNLYWVLRRNDGLRMDLYLAPTPFSEIALKQAAARVNRFNGADDCRIVHADAAQSQALQRLGWRIREVDQEMIYDRDLVLASQGKAFTRLRRNLNQARQTQNLDIRPYTPDDHDDCLRLIRDWEADYKARQTGKSDGVAYVRRSLASLDSLDATVFRAEVARHEGRVVALTSGGRIAPDYDAILVAINDASIPRMSYLQRFSFIQNCTGVRYVNDGSNARQAGLAEVKRAFNPVDTVTLWRAQYPES